MKAQRVDLLTLVILDAAGRMHQLAIIRCPSCKGLTIGIKGMQPFHMNAAESMVLIEALRTGPACPLLARKETREYRAAHQPVGDAGSWLLMVADATPNLVDFTGSGMGRNEPGMIRYISLDKAAREEFSDLLFRELMADGAESARA